MSGWGEFGRLGCFAPLFSQRIWREAVVQLLLDAFVPPDAPAVLGIDETIERRRGSKIAAKGI